MRFINLLQFATVLFFALPAFEQEAAAASGDMKYFAAAFAISVAAFGGAIAQGRAAATALEGIARNPGARGDIFTPMILALALIESLVIYALLIAFSILG